MELSCLVCQQQLSCIEAGSQWHCCVARWTLALHHELYCHMTGSITAKTWLTSLIKLNATDDWKKQNVEMKTAECYIADWKTCYIADWKTWGEEIGCRLLKLKWLENEVTYRWICRLEKWRLQSTAENKRCRCEPCLSVYVSICIHNSNLNYLNFETI